jgi:hypothetical protein
MPVSATKHEHKRCPRCGRTFECRANKPVHCGCAEVELTIDRAQEIALTYDDCLCTGCLREIAGTSARTFQRGIILRPISSTEDLTP